MTKLNIAVLTPAHNEGKVIHKWLLGLLRAGVPLEKCFVVDDGSTDNTVETLTSLGFPADNILQLAKNSGKSSAISQAVSHFNLGRDFEWVATLDADTVVDVTYWKRLNSTLSEQPNDVAAVCGQVKANHGSWNPFVNYRIYEYFINHFIYKFAQDKLNVVTVMPGCVSAIRAKIFARLVKEPDLDLLTEDMDWTMRIHQEKLGRIRMDEKLLVNTQDPASLKDYAKQTQRWRRGLWQVYKKRSLWNLARSLVNWEILLLVLDEVIFSTGLLIGLSLLLSSRGSIMTSMFLLVDVALFSALVSEVAIRYKDLKLILFIPIFYLLRVLNCFIFFYTMAEILILRRDPSSLRWNQVARHNA